MPNANQIQKAIHHLFRQEEGRPLLGTYAILDAARDDKIYPALTEADTESLCLYLGDKAEELAAVAPYLLSLTQEDPFTQWLMNNGWGRSWGIFVRSSASLKELHRHFRKFLMVYAEKGTPLYFRYYDPRVLRVYLPTCNEFELQILFGPVEHYYVEGKVENQLIEFGCTEKFALVQSVIHL
jgi:hypothetical protein